MLHLPTRICIHNLIQTRKYNKQLQKVSKKALSLQVCVFPVFLIGILLSANVNIPKSQKLAFSVIWLLIANSSINPILYGLLNKNFRAVYLIKIQRCLGLPHHTPHKSPGLSSSMGPASVVMNGTESSCAVTQGTTRCHFNAVLEDH